jgi:DNA-binding NarL/FixJ family response regulator
MINKVLIAEDHETSNLSLQKVMEELGISQIDYVYYCDDALKQIRQATDRQESYDLLITDLHFEEDGQPQQLTGGLQLIPAARAIQPDLKILVFSAESKPATIEGLFKQYEVDGYVRKARSDAKELRLAIENLANNQRYFPRHLRQLLDSKNAFEFSSFDIAVLKLLADGVRQKDIPVYLQEQQIRPSGLSSVEKRLNLLKEEHAFATNEQLIAFCKDLGII